MARPTLPATGATGWQDILNAAIDDVSDRADSALAQTASGVPGCVLLDSFTGAADADKLDAAMSYAAAQSTPPAILLAARTYTFGRSVKAYDGFALIGAPSMNNAELSNKGTFRTKVIANPANSVWLDASSGGGRSASQVWDMCIRNIAFTGSSTTQWLGGGSVTLWACNLRDCSFSGFKSILGSQATKLLLDLCLLDGWLEFNNSYNGAIHIGGADNMLFLGMTNIDSGTSFNTAGGATGQYHLWLDYCAKTVVGGVYITCEGNWGGLKVSGPSNPATSGGSNLGGPIWLSGAKIEGRNAGAPCNGANVRVEGGMLNVHRSWVSYGMASPSSMGHSPADAGMVHQTAGYLLLDGCTYDRASAVGETTPFLYQGGGEGRILNQSRGSTGGAWAGLPQVHSAAGTLTSDSTVTVA